MYPLRIRSSAASIATTGNWMFNFLIGFLTPIITDKIGYNYGYVFTVCNALIVMIVFFFYYESSNLTLEQVDMMYNDPTCKPWKSSTWIAPGTEYRGGPVVGSADEEVRKGNESHISDVSSSINQKDNITKA